MSLATSCPSCGTVFKVIEDQLKVSEGWVRCGHCHEVFNALEGLFDLAGRQRPPAPPPQAASPTPLRRVAVPGVTDPPPPSPAQRPKAEEFRAENPADWIETRPAMFSDVVALREQQAQREADRLKRLATPDAPATQASEPDNRPPEQMPPAPEALLPVSPPPAAMPQVSARQAADNLIETPPLSRPGTLNPSRSLDDEAVTTEFIDFGHADTVFQPHEPSTLFDDSMGGYGPLPPVAEEVEPPSGHGWQSAMPSADVSAPSAAAIPAVAGSVASAEALPTFVRQADRAAWWRKPVIRALLMAGCGVAAAALILQLALNQRDLLAARWPQLHDPLSGICAVLDCTLQAPRQLDSLVVENTALTRPAGVDGYRLQVLLRNRAEFPIRAPHLEFCLTDSSGAVIVRRVLSPADFGQGPALSAGGDGNWTLELSSNDKRIAGYTVAAFYP